MITGGSATASVTVSELNDFTDTVTLTASKSWVTFSPSSIVGSGTSAMSVNVPAGTTAGTYSITVIGTSGSLSHPTTVNVNVQDFTISTSPSTLTVTSGGSATSTVAITTFDGFTGTVTVGASSSWATFNPSSVAAPGTTLMTVTVPASTVTGTYPITVTGSSGSLSHSTTVNVNVQTPTPPLSVTVKTDKSSYSRGQTVSITVSVTNGGIVIQSASVSVRVKNPGGSTSTYSATTDVKGNAVIKYKLSILAQRGTYTVTSTTSKTGYKSASATINFSVK